MIPSQTSEASKFLKQTMWGSNAESKVVRLRATLLQPAVLRRDSLRLSASARLPSRSSLDSDSPA